MATSKQIPCKTCGKMFTPCAFCEKHNDTFRWRNFACSIECAKEYIKKVEEGRAKKHNKPEVTPVVEEKKPYKKDKFFNKNIETAVVPEPIVAVPPTFEEVNGDVVAEAVAIEE